MSQPRIQDRFYSQLIGSIAVTTALSDREAQENGLKFTDSQVKAVFHRAIRTLEGKPPKPKEPTSEKERRQAKLYDDLLKLRPTILVTNRETGEKGPLPVAMYLKALRAAKQSLEQNRSGEAGGRIYIEGAHRTLAQVEAAKADDQENDQGDAETEADDAEGASEPS